jgi:endonuclease/exonuclease/phosphatase (EEP) superfamily protein YafD
VKKLRVKTPWRNRVLTPPALLLLAVGVLGLLLRYTIKDRLPILAAVFYGLPPLVAVVALTGSLVMHLLLARRRGVVASGLLTVLAVAAWIHTDFAWATAPELAASGLRVVLWNACPMRDPSDGAVALLQETDAQIILLVESGGSSDFHKQRWQSYFPDYHVSVLGHEMTFLSRYPMSETKLYKMGKRTKITVYDLTTPFGPVSVLGVDIESNPLSWRKPFVDRIHEIARSKPHPVIVLGDFNTPHTSAHFAVLRRSFQHAVEKSGTGLITTWLGPCPLLALDHVWLSEHFTPIRATLRRTFHSDHALVMADVSLENAGQPHTPRARSTDD